MSNLVFVIHMQSESNVHSNPNQRFFLTRREGRRIIRPWVELLKEDPSLAGRVKHCPPGVAHGAMKDVASCVIPSVMFDGMVGHKPHR